MHWRRPCDVWRSPELARVAAAPCEESHAARVHMCGGDALASYGAFSPLQRDGRESIFINGCGRDGRELFLDGWSDLKKGRFAWMREA